MRPRPFDPVARERRCIELLRQMQSARFVLIGGYAVSSYGLIRFSVDLDIVVGAPDVDLIRTVLQREGLEKDDDVTGAAPSGISFERWSDGLVSVDLLVGGVFDRRSGARFAVELVAAGASDRRISGRTASIDASARVAAPETLVVLKLCAGRRVDLRDVAILSRLNLSAAAMKTLITSSPGNAVLHSIEGLEQALPTPQFRDSLKGEFMMKDKRFEECIASARRLCTAIRGLVSTLP